MATMADVAQLAGVSVSTVSHVVNDTRPVRPETRRRVEDAMHATGFRRNALASALVTARTRTLGVSVSALSNPYFAHLLSSMEARARARHYAIVLRDSHDAGDVESGNIDALLGWQVDGLLVAPAPGLSAGLERAVRERVPVVLIDRHAPLDCDQVAPDNEEPAALLAGHLAERGHERLALLRGLPGLQSTTERLAGATRAAAAAGCAVDILAGDSHGDVAYAAVRAAFAGPDRPSALLSLNNAMTIGAMRALSDLGLRIGPDVAFACYDDFEWADFLTPRLTAVAQDVAGMGARAVDLLLDRLEGYTGPPRVERVPTRYHHRDSCGCLGG